jgi:hypothetical protein
MRKLMLGLFTALLFALSQETHAASDEIPTSKLPKLVTKILEIKYPAAELVTAFKDVEDEETLFSVILKFKKFEYEVAITAEGEILETAKTLTAKDLPEAVVTALQAKYRNSKIKEAVEVREPGQSITQTFHVEIDTAQKATLEVILDAKGKVLNESAKQDKK